MRSADSPKQIGHTAATVRDVFAGPQASLRGDSRMSYGNFLAPDSGSQAEQPSLARGIAAGVGAALAGAVAWALVGLLTGFQLGLIAVGIGHLVGIAMARFGRTSGAPTLYAAAAIAFCGALVGHLGWIYAAASRETGLGLGTVINLVGPIDVLTDTNITEPLSWLFFLLAPWAAVSATNRATRAPKPLTGPASSYPPPVYPPPVYTPPVYTPPVSTPEAAPGPGVIASDPVGEPGESSSPLSDQGRIT
jgi:hypothetical protein